MPGKGRNRQCGPVCSPKRGVSFSTTLNFFFPFFLWPYHVACGILVLQPVTWALEGGVLTTGLPGKSHNPAQFLTSLIIIIKKKCGLVEGTLKVALTCSM